MTLALRALLVLFLGFFGGWWVSAGVGFWYMDKANVFDRDGGASMALMFMVAPFFGAIIAVVLTASTVYRERAKIRRAQAGLPPEPASLAYRIARGLLAAVAVYLGVWLLINLFVNPLPDPVMRLLVADGIPALIGIAAGAWAFARRT